MNGSKNGVTPAIDTAAAVPTAVHQDGFRAQAAADREEAGRA